MFLQNSNTATRVIEDASQVPKIAYKSINDLLVALIEQLPLFGAGIVVIIVFWLVAKILRGIFWATSSRTKLDNRLRILFSRLIGTAIFVIGIFAAFTVIFPSLQFRDLIAGLGFTSFIVGFATKDILNNLLSGVLILWKQPFQVGDYIFIKDKQGKVEYIGVRATILRMDDGEKILMPNGDMYSQALTIRNAGAERRIKQQISIGYEADIKQAKGKISKALTNLEGVLDEPKPDVFVTELASDGVKISIYFWINTNTHKTMQVVDEATTAIKDVLNKSDIEIYPPNSIIVQNAENNSPANYDNGKEDL